MSISDIDDAEEVPLPPAKVGYGCPPEHSQFKPGQSGNPSGRSKGSQNFKTLFNKILNEEISLREGSDVKKLSKAEAIVRGQVAESARIEVDIEGANFTFREAQAADAPLELAEH